MGTSERSCEKWQKSDNNIYRKILKNHYSERFGGWTERNNINLITWTNVTSWKANQRLYSLFHGFLWASRPPAQLAEKNYIFKKRSRVRFIKKLEINVVLAYANIPVLIFVFSRRPGLKLNSSAFQKIDFDLTNLGSYRGLKHDWRWTLLRFEALLLAQEELSFCQGTQQLPP